MSNHLAATSAQWPFTTLLEGKSETLHNFAVPMFQSMSTSCVIGQIVFIVEAHDGAREFASFNFQFLHSMIQTRCTRLSC